MGVGPYSLGEKSNYRVFGVRVSLFLRCTDLPRRTERHVSDELIIDLDKHRRAVSTLMSLRFAYDSPIEPNSDCVRLDVECLFFSAEIAPGSNHGAAGREYDTVMAAVRNTKNPCHAGLLVCWFSLNWKTAGFELATKDDIP